MINSVIQVYMCVVQQKIVFVRVWIYLKYLIVINIYIDNEISDYQFFVNIR